MSAAGDEPAVRLAEVVGALSLGIDLGFGQPMEHVLRQSVIALRLAEQLGLTADERSVVYYTALLVTVGCHTDAHEQAKWFGDDIEMKSHKYDHEKSGVRDMVGMLRMVGRGNTALPRFRIGLEFAVSGLKDMSGMIASHAALAQSLAHELELDPDVQDAVGASYEAWNGKGFPGTHAGAQIPIASRISALAEIMEVAHRVGGVERAVRIARKRSGSQFDPDVVDAFCAHADAILGDLDRRRTWDAVVDAEPALGVLLSGERLDAALLGVASFVDLKSPYLLGHARAVSELCEAAGARLGLRDPELTRLRRAGAAHGLGRLGVSNSIWDKPGPLGPGEWERVRMHPYLTERMLQQSRALAPIGAIAVQLRERVDGSGYPRGLSGSAIGLEARVLAAADAYQAMLEPRPHRAALDADEAAAQLRADVRAGRFAGNAVEAVLAAAGHRVSRRPEGPAGLTAREIDVLRLVALGLSSKQIAEQLVISPKTTRNHIEHIYAKIQASNRAQASLFAMQQGLIPAHQYVAG